MVSTKVLLPVLIILKCANGTRSRPKITFCQEQSILLGSETNMAKVVDSYISSSIQLECNFCNEKDDHSPKIWYFKKRGFPDKPCEVTIGMDTDAALNKISVTTSHSLIVTNFSLVDSGIYSCKPLNDNHETIFTYVLESKQVNMNAGVFDLEIMPKIGKMSQWREYKRLKLDPVNEKFQTSDEPIFRYMRENLNFTFRLVTSWEPWGPCEACARTKGHATRKKEGKCRLHPLLVAHVLQPTNDSFVRNMTALYLEDDYDVSCRSFLLNETFPELSEKVRILPEFEEVERCSGVCLSASAEQDVLSKKYDYKYQISKKMTEKSHLQLYCPEATLDSNVVWFKDKKLLDSSYRNNMANGEDEPNITIDAFNCLRILHATKNEEGVYACTVDGEKMQRCIVEVISKSKLLSEEFLRYSIYLAFVLTLSMTCYCAGICVAWRRRSSFADPLNLRIKDKETKFENGEGASEGTPFLY